MDWALVDFTGITSEITGILPEVIPVAIGVLAIGLALRYGKRVFKMFA